MSGVASLLVLATPALLFGSTAELCASSGRRHVLAAAAGAAFAIPVQRASAKSTAAQYASGYIAPKSKAEIQAELEEQIFSKPPTASKFDYTSDAIVVDGSGSGKPVINKGGTGAPFISSPSTAKLTLLKLANEGNDLAHAVYNFKSEGRSYTGSCRAINVAGAWKIDQDLYPLDNPKAYVLLQPKRDIYGGVFMELDKRVTAK